MVHKHHRLRSGSDSIIERIILTVAAYDNSPVDELPPLRNVIDPDAIESLFSNDPSNVEVMFEYNGFEVSVRASDPGLVEVLVR